MPRIFDNIEQDFLTAFCRTLNITEQVGFCTGAFANSTILNLVVFYV